MIVETQNDIFRSTRETLLIPCNAAGAMGAGLAKEFAHRYQPFALRTYRRYFPLVVDPAKLPRDDGRAEQLVCLHMPNGKKVLLFCTKYHWSEPSDLALIERNLQKLKQRRCNAGITSLAVPPIGCGYGRLDYKRQVRPLLFKYLSEENFDVEIVGLRAADMP